MSPLIWYVALGSAAGGVGGYTTFSTFSYEAIALVESGDYAHAVTYILASVVLALVGTFAGIALGDAALGWSGRAP